MRDISYFSANTVASFENSYDNMLEFNSLMVNASNREYGKYSAKECDTIIRNQINTLFGGDIAKMSEIKRMQAWRDHGKEFAALIEDVMEDKMVSGWDAANARFMDLVESRNIARGDKQEFFVEDSSLLQVSKFAGNHHDIDFSDYHYCFNSVRVA